MPEKLSLHRKLAQVMYEAERIPKNGTAPAQMGGYKFVEVGDAADFIRKALAEKVVTMMPTSIEVLGEVEHPTAKGGTMTTYTIRMDWTITDGESGETFVVPSLGVGSDTGDKFASKATTNAMKYALLSGFLLSTGDDNERANLPDRQPRQHPGLVDGDPSARLPEPPYNPPDGRPELERRADGLIGVVVRGNDPTADLGLHLEPDGNSYFGFKLKSGRTAYHAVATGPLAEQLNTATLMSDGSLEGQSVEVWGRIEMVPFRKGNHESSYPQIIIERIKTDDWTLPAVEIDTISMFEEAKS